MRRKVVVGAPPRPPSIDPRDIIDRREVCPRHGWVGSKSFLADRHDLCEVLHDADQPVAAPELPALVPELMPGKKRRLSVRERGIPRKKTLSVRRISQLEVVDAEFDYARPKTRAECVKCPICQLVRDHKSTGRDRVAMETAKACGLKRTRKGALLCNHMPDEMIFHSRPCVMVGCKAALFLDVNPMTGSITLNFPHLEPEEVAADRSCALDLTERGGMTLDEVGEVLSITRERTRQLESRGLVRLISLMEAADIDRRDAAATGRRLVGPSQDLEESGVTGDLPGELTYLPGGGGG